MVHLSLHGTPPAGRVLASRHTYLSLSLAHPPRRDAQQGGTGSKWTISAFAQWMRGQGHDFDALWAQVAQIVCKTLIAAQPMLQYQVPTRLLCIKGQECLQTGPGQ